MNRHFNSFAYDSHPEKPWLITNHASAVIKSEWEKSFEAILQQTRQTLNRINNSDSISKGKYSSNKHQLATDSRISSYPQSSSISHGEVSDTSSALYLQSNLLDRIMDRLRNLETSKRVNTDGETLHLQNKLAKVERTLEDLQFQVERMRKSQLEDKSVKSSGGSYQNLCRVENDLNKRDLEDLKGKTSDCVLYMQGLEERLVAVEGKIGLITKSVEDKFEAIHSALFVLDNSARTTKDELKGLGDKLSKVESCQINNEGLHSISIENLVEKQKRLSDQLAQFETVNGKARCDIEMTIAKLVSKDKLIAMKDEIQEKIQAKCTQLQLEIKASHSTHTVSCTEQTLRSLETVQQRLSQLESSCAIKESSPTVSTAELEKLTQLSKTVDSLTIQFETAEKKCTDALSVFSIRAEEVVSTLADYKSTVALLIKDVAILRDRFDFASVAPPQIIPKSVDIDNGKNAPRKPQLFDHLTAHQGDDRPLPERGTECAGIEKKAPVHSEERNGYSLSYIDLHAASPPPPPSPDASTVEPHVIAEAEEPKVVKFAEFIKSAKCDLTNVEEVEAEVRHDRVETEIPDETVVSSPRHVADGDGAKEESGSIIPVIEEGLSRQSGDEYDDDEFDDRSDVVSDTVERLAGSLGSPLKSEQENDAEPTDSKESNAISDDVISEESVEEVIEEEIADESTSDDSKYRLNSSSSSDSVSVSSKSSIASSADGNAQTNELDSTEVPETDADALYEPAGMFSRRNSAALDDAHAAIAQAQDTQRVFSKGLSARERLKMRQEQFMTNG